ncbi:replication initiation factor domain-containing protein [Streptococcus sp. A22]|uniref:replication initiation factor domain-containing protein n=1 Tax=Streptococcus sp. A22 TaxID=3373126 RepID=UPI00374CD150
MNIENSYLIDWLSFTVKVGSPLEAIEQVGLGKVDFVESESGRYGYERAYTMGGIINVFYSENRSDMGVHIEMTGQGVRIFEGMMEAEGLTWFDVFSHLQGFVSFSRIDLALDEFEGLVSFDDIIGKIERGEHVGRCRAFKVIAGRDSDGNHTGTTIYMGSNKSDVMLRVYEKKYERQQKGYEVDAEIWNRWELVLKHEKANSFVAQLLGNGYNFGEIFKGVLSDLIRFVEPSNDSNKRRWAVSPWWSEFLESVEPIKLKGREYQPSLAKTLNWVEASTLTAIKGLSTIAKEEKVDFMKLLEGANTHNQEKADKMVREYKGMRPVEKAKFQTRLQKIGQKCP